MEKFVALIMLAVVFMSCGPNTSVEKIEDVNKIEEFSPEDSITFPHSVHDNAGIDCNYCHNEETREDRHNLTVTLCTNCHKTIRGADSDSTPSTGKIH